MPAYSLICTECDTTVDDLVCSVREREKMRCQAPGKGGKPCFGKLTNDYSRHETSHFSLKGNFPGKMIAIENKLRKEGEKM